jgi:uncharacterized membrane protein
MRKDGLILINIHNIYRETGKDDWFSSEVYAYVIFKAAIWLVSLNFADESWSFYARNSAPLPIEWRKQHSAALCCRQFKMAAMAVWYRATTGIRVNMYKVSGQ